MSLKNILLIFLFFFGLKTVAQQAPANYPEQVGDIAFDPNTDKADFLICEPKIIYQYYNCGTTYKGEKKALKEHVFGRYAFNNRFSDVNGFVVIRFVVNCKGETDRFRVTEISPDYKPAKFPKELTDQLLAITRSLKDWIPCSAQDGKKYNSYVYLNFILKDGKIQDVGP